jgi:Amt family ammonium transporter
MILDNKRIYLFTDGITESLDDQGNEMGVEGTQKLIKNKSNSNIQKEIKNVVTEITINKSLKDDITILAIGE